MRTIKLGMLLFACSTLTALAQTPSYKPVKTIELGAPDRWDYVHFDPGSGRIYVAHGDRLAVLDGRDGHNIGNVEGIPGGTHGTGISSATGQGFTDDGKAGTVVAFDLKTFKVTKHIPAKDDADGIVYDPSSKHIFVVDGDSATLTVVGPKTDEVIASIPTGGGMESPAADGDGKVYVNGSDNREIDRVDSATNKIDARWPVGDCVSPHGIALDGTNHRLFTTCLNGLMKVVNTDNGKVVATVPIGDGTDGAAFDPKRKLVFSSNADGTISVIRENDPDHFSVAGTIKTRFIGKNIDINPDTGRLYVVGALVDPEAPPPPMRNGRPGRPKALAGSVRVVFFDPAS